MTIAVGSVPCPRCRCWRSPDPGRPCKGCVRLDGWAAEVGPGRHRCNGCGTPIAAEHSWCTKCRSKRTPYDAAYRRRRAEALFPADVRAAVLEELADGLELREVCDAHNVTPQRVFAWRRFEPEWSARLDAALMAGRDPSLDHGTPRAFRHGRCRCPECRVAHREASARSGWR
jgi:hypothetical protein